MSGEEKKGTITVMHHDILLQIQEFRGALEETNKTFAIEMRVVTKQLSDISAELKGMMTEYRSTQTDVRGYGATIQRQGNEINDLTKRVRFLERAYWIAMGIVSAFNLLVNLPKITELFK